jgi:hypothetical protein
MFVKVGKKEYQVTFYHARNIHYTKVSGITEADGQRMEILKEKKSKSRDVTYCSIQEAKNNKQVSSGLSIRNPKDRLNKKVGKRVSLRNALANSKFSRKDNLVFWEKFDEIF